MKNLVYNNVDPSKDILYKNLEIGDTLLYISPNGSAINLIASREIDNGSCNGCYFNEATSSCLNSDILGCYDYNIIFRLIDDSFIKFSDIRRSICNEDICLYYRDECNKYEESDDLCLLKRIAKYRRNEI